MSRRVLITLGVIVAVGTAVLAATAFGQHHASTHTATPHPPTTHPLVQPTIVPGNPADCGAGTRRHPGLGFTGATTLKYDSSMSGTATDGTLTITVNTADQITFSFSAQLPAGQVIWAVYAKGGNQGGNLYDYTKLPGGGVLSDSGLHPPLTGNNGNGGFAAISHILFCYGPGTTPPKPTAAVYAGYAYNLHGNVPAFPSPWDGGTQNGQPVVFVGCNFNTPKVCASPGGVDQYDSGAIRIDNTSSAAITVTAVHVAVGPCNFDIWPGLNMTLAAGQTGILTQTGGNATCGTALFPANFDSSEGGPPGVNPPALCSTNNGIIGVVSFSVNGTPMTFHDTGQALNDKGTDPGATSCGTLGEFQPWTPLGP